MSFILDALRKSESERRRGSVPAIAHVPLAVARPGLPRWAIAVMALLGASVIALAAAWWLTLAGRDRPAVASAPPERTVEIPLPPESTAVEPPRRIAAVAPPPVQTARPAASLRAAAGVPDERSAPAPSATPAPARAAPAATSTPALPSAAELEAQGTDLPDLRLELHVYAANPSSRYVFVNGKMYREGETLREGPELVRIDPKGAVLRHGGREFLLSQ